MDGIGSLLQSQADGVLGQLSAEDLTLENPVLASESATFGLPGATEAPLSLSELSQGSSMAQGAIPAQVTASPQSAQMTPEEIKQMREDYFAQAQDKASKSKSFQDLAAQAASKM